MRKLNYLLAILVVAALWACEEDSKDVYLSVDNDTLEFTGEGGTVELKINSDGDWSITNTPDWLSFSTMSGVNTQSVSVTASPNLTGTLREAEFLVRTNSGSGQKTVKAVQTAGATEVRQFNVPDVSKRWMNGHLQTTGAKDSVYIDANVAWTADGPDWIQASFGNLQFPLTGTVQKTGSGFLVLLPKTDNDSFDDKEGVIRISSPNSSKVYEIPVAQLGRGHVVPRDPLLMAHGYATSFKFGKDVARIQFKLFEGKANDSEVTTTAANESWNGGRLTDTSYLSYYNKKPNTQYELCVRTVNSGNYYITEGLNRFTFTTPSDIGQPICEIQDVKYSDNTLTYNLTMNSFATGYYHYATTAESLLSKDELSMAYLMRNWIREYPDNHPLRTENLKNVTHRDITTNALIVTWALGADSQLSTVLTRTLFSISNSARSMQHEQTDYIGDYVEDSKSLPKPNFK